MVWCKWTFNCLLCAKFFIYLKKKEVGMDSLYASIQQQPWLYFMCWIISDIVLIK